MAAFGLLAQVILTPLQATPVNPPNVLNPDNVPITPAPQTPTPI